MPTEGTEFATREPTVDLHDRLALGLDHADCGADRGVREGTGKAVVFDHAPEMEVFDIDRIEPTRQHRTELVQAIAPRIGNLFMQPSHTAGVLPVSIRAPLFSGQPPLSAGQQGRFPSKMARVRNRLPGREGRQGEHAEVDADRLTGADAFHGSDFDDHRDVVATRRMPRDGDGAGVGRHRPTETQRQHPELGKGQALGLTVKLEGAAGVFSAVSRPALFLEGGIGAALSEEIHEGGLQVTKGLLHGDTRHVVQEGHVRVTFQRGQLGAGADKRQPLPALEGHGPRRQHPVVDQAATAKGLRQVFSLRGSGIGSEGPTTCHGLIINHLAIEMKSSGGTRFLPGLNAGVSARGTR